jgi:hypothetical protein
MSTRQETKPNWMKREEHWKAIDAAHRSLDHYDNKGRLRRFSGAPFFELILKSGHDCGVYENCSCNRRP